MNPKTEAKGRESNESNAQKIYRAPTPNGKNDAKEKEVTEHNKTSHMTQPKQRKQGLIKPKQNSTKRDPQLNKETRG